MNLFHHFESVTVEDGVVYKPWFFYQQYLGIEQNGVDTSSYHSIFNLWPANIFRQQYELCIPSTLLRFRDLRTITNLLMSQVAVTNLLNLTVGVSIFIDYEILELHQLENKLSASIFLFCEQYFVLANSMVMALVVVDCFLAIQFDMKYTTGWRTKRRIICSIIFCWLSLLVLMLLNLNNPNLGKVPVWKYKLATSNTVYLDSVKAVFLVAFMILTILTWRSLKNRKNAVKRLGGRKNLVMESDEMKAARTIAIIAACYSCCTGLSILFQQLSKNELYKKRKHVFRWFHFSEPIFFDASQP